MYSIHITRSAKNDIKECYDYVFDVLKNPSAAEKLLDEVESAFRKLELDPTHFPKSSDALLALLGIRFIMVNNYMCFYKYDSLANEVYIIRFLYGKRNWKELLRDLP